MDKNYRQQHIAAGIKQLLLTYGMLFLQLLIFLFSANLVFDFRVQFFFATSFVHSSIGIAVQYGVNPDLMIKRLKIKRRGSKLWDEILMRASNLMMLVVAPAVAGLDVGRFMVTSFPFYFVALGFAFFVISTVLLNWAMAVNVHFEPTVRIQEKHRVIATGPYEIIRHPGYLAGIMYSMSIPFIIGSVMALIPVGLYVILMIVRTWLEDKTLQRELVGYREYAELTKSRLIPGIW